MLILDKPREFEGHLVKIPLYHRGHLSLFPGAKVWLCLLPASRGGEIFPELVVSPIHFDSWPDLWRIRVALFERKGLVHDLFEVLREHSINILASESSSMEWQRLHSIEIIVDANRYSGAEDGTHEDRSAGRIDELAGLRRAILARVMSDICFDSLERPRVSIRRVRNLFEARRAFVVAQRGHSGGLAPVVKDTTIYRHPTNKGVFIKLPPEVRRGLQHAHPLGRGGGFGKYLLVSETTDRFLRVFFLRESDTILAPTLLHKEEVGALAAITDAIVGADFNIITSLSRLYEHGTLAQSEFVLRHEADPRRSATGQTLKKRLEDSLATPDLVETYDIRIAYPKGYNATLKPKRLVSHRKTFKLKLPFRRKQVQEESIEATLVGLHRAYLDRYRRPGADDLDRMRFTLTSSLLAEMEPREKRKSIPLFISYAFKDEDRFKRIQNSARSMGFLVTTGRQLGADSTHRDGIRRLMQQCTHFLGVWSEEGGIQVGQGRNVRWWPSPWLHWELGVAESLGLRWRLLIADSIEQDAWQKLTATTPHQMFSKVNFDKSFREALQILKTMK